MSVSSRSVAENPEVEDKERARMLWRCRRGIREMDLMLQQFVAGHFSELDEARRQVFADLLNESDLDIMAWVIGSRLPPREDYVPLLRSLAEYSCHAEGSEPSS